jgi:uncharacterized membrane protein
MGDQLPGTGGPQREGTSDAGVPRWPATVAILLVGGLYLVISDAYSVGPPWLALAGALALLSPLWTARARGHHRVAHRLGRAAIAAQTLAVAGSAILLLVRLTQGRTQALDLLRDAALIWLANIVTFAVWYWELDGGGPAERHPGRHSSTDFAFPQQQQDDDDVVEGWSPGFVDYLFLAFNTSTAFSPTDTLVLSRRMKLLMMAQSLISLLVVAVLAARAINTINPGGP